MIDAFSSGVAPSSIAGTGGSSDSIDVCGRTASAVGEPDQSLSVTDNSPWLSSATRVT